MDDKRSTVGGIGFNFLENSRLANTRLTANDDDSTMAINHVIYC